MEGAQSEIKKCVAKSGRHHSNRLSSFRWEKMHHKKWFQKIWICTVNTYTSRRRLSKCWMLSFKKSIDGWILIYIFLMNVWHPWWYGYFMPEMNYINGLHISVFCRSWITCASCLSLSLSLWLWLCVWECTVQFQ